MCPVLITAPTADVVTVAELRIMCSLPDSVDAAQIEAARDAVVGQIDQAAGGWIGRSLRPATWELRLDQFPCEDEIELPYPPCTSVVSVTYTDTAGVTQTAVEGTDYRVFLDPFGKSEIKPVYGGWWPAARYDEDSVKIRYVAGYVGDALPKQIKSAVALGVRRLISLGERNLFLQSVEVVGVQTKRWVMSDQAGKVIDDAIMSLLGTLRVWG